MSNDVWSDFIFSCNLQNKDKQTIVGSKIQQTSIGDTSQDAFFQGVR